MSKKADKQEKPPKKSKTAGVTEDVFASFDIEKSQIESDAYKNNKVTLFSNTVKNGGISTIIYMPTWVEEECCR